MPNHRDTLFGKVTEKSGLVDWTHLSGLIGFSSKKVLAEALPYSINPIDLRPIAPDVVLFGARCATAVFHVLHGKSSELSDDIGPLAGQILRFRDVQPQVIKLALSRIKKSLF